MRFPPQHRVWVVWVIPSNEPLDYENRFDIHLSFLLFPFPHSLLSLLPQLSFTRVALRAITDSIAVYDGCSLSPFSSFSPFAPASPPVLLYLQGPMLAPLPALSLLSCVTVVHSPSQSPTVRPQGGSPSKNPLPPPTPTASPRRPCPRPGPRPRPHPHPRHPPAARAARTTDWVEALATQPPGVASAPQSTQDPTAKPRSAPPIVTAAAAA